MIIIVVIVIECECVCVWFVVVVAILKFSALLTFLKLELSNRFQSSFIFVVFISYYFAAEPTFSQSGPASVKRGSRCPSTKEMATGLKVGLMYEVSSVTRMLVCMLLAFCTVQCCMQNFL